MVTCVSWRRGNTMTPLQVIAAFFAVIATSVVGWFGYRASLIGHLVNRVNSLEGLSSLLQAKVNDISRELSDVKAENTIKHAENEELKADNILLRADNAELKGANLILTADNRELRAANVRLVSDNQELQASVHLVEEQNTEILRRTIPGRASTLERLGPVCREEQEAGE